MRGIGFLINDDSSLCLSEMMNDSDENDGRMENEYDHNGQLLVIEHLQNMVVLHKCYIGLLLIKYGKIRHQMFIFLFQMLIITN